MSRWRRSLTWALGLVLLGVLGSWAAAAASPPDASPGRALGDLFLEVWTTADGLPHSQPQAIAQSAEGFLWLATWEGAARFNGHEFELVDRSVLPEVQDAAATELAVDEDGQVLIATARGELLEHAGLGWRSVPRAAGGRGLPIYALTVSRGERWVGSAGDGLWVQPRGGVLAPAQGTSVPGDAIVYALAADPAGQDLWVGTDRGLHRRRDGRWQGPESLGREAGRPVLSLARMEDGSLLVGTVSGVFRLRAETWDLLHPGIPDVPVESLRVDRRGEVWIGTASDGLFRLGQRGLEQLDMQGGLPSDRVVSLFEDIEGSLWIGTSRGLARLREASFVAVTERQGLADVYTRTVLALPGNRILAGTSSGIALIGPTPSGHRVLRRDLAEESVLAAALGADGSLWLGTYYNGVIRYRDGEVLQRLGGEDGLPSIQVRSLLAEPDGTLQIGTSRGLARWNGRHLAVFTAADGLPSESVMSLYRDGDGVLWIGTSAGVAVERGGRFERLDPAHTGGGGRIYGLSGDASGRLFIAHDRGVSMREDDRWVTLGSAQGLPIASVFAVLQDAHGDFWMCSNRGVLRVPRAAALAAWREGARLRGWELFGEADGMASSQCNGAAGQPAAIDEAGRLWFATAGGPVLVDPAHVNDLSRIEPGVRIEHLRADGRELPPATELVLPRRVQRLEVQYVGLNFQIPRKIRYRYRLEGFDPGWVEAGGRRILQLTNLPPGDYVLRIQAASPSGQWSRDEARLALRVEPWWWETAPAQVLALLLLGLVALLVRWRTWRLELQRAALRRQVERATADLQRQAEQLQAQNAELDAYAHSVAHDLKNPLATVLGMSTLLRNVGASMPAERQAEMLDRIHAAGQRMVGIIDSLLLLGRERHDPDFGLRPVALGPLVEDTLAAFRERIAAARATVAVTPELPVVVGYAPWIERVLANYVGNALKYGGEPPRIEIGWDDLGETVEVWVLDHGPGIAPERQARLFQAFSRAGRVGGDGTGLGLSIVRRIVERMGGSVGCDSAPGEGARFWFRLPKAGEEKGVKA